MNTTINGASPQSIQINSRFKSLIPPLAPEELAQLERNILADGCRDPLVTWNGVLLDGHNRFDICQRHGLPFKSMPLIFTGEDAAQVWIIRNQFGRRNLAPFTRVELALKLEPLLKEKAKENQRNGGQSSKVGRQKSDKPLDTKKDLAKVAGVSHDTIAKGKLVAQHADEETKQRLRNNQISVHRVAKDIKEKIQRDNRHSERVRAAAVNTIDSRIIVGDFREVSRKLADGSVSLIFTDPPYDREASKMLPALAEFASNKLAHGGSLICYVGQTQLPAALNAFCEQLRYWWSIASVHCSSGNSTVMREYGINNGWKLVLWFVKGTRDNNSIFVNDVMSGEKEKTHHDWQQSESEAAYWIEKLCPKDGLVCDPFLGGGTTAVAAKKLNRSWIGIELDPDTAKIASARLGSAHARKEAA